MQKDLIYKVYVTDALRAVDSLLGGQPNKERYYELIEKKSKIETRTAEEIINHIKEGLNNLSDGG